MKKYLLKGTRYVGGSDFTSSGRRFESVEYEFLANNDDHARERARQHSDITGQNLFVEVSLSESNETTPTR